MSKPNFAGCAALALAQQPPPPPLTMKQLTPGVWVGLGGAGGNSTIIIGKTSVIVVDVCDVPASTVFISGAFGGAPD